MKQSYGLFQNKSGDSSASPQNDDTKVDIVTIDAGWTKLELILPIVKKPENAYITEKVRHTLKKINKVFPIIIVTGRPFYVIKKKVKVAKFIYTASHGLEWNLNNKLERY